MPQGDGWLKSVRFKAISGIETAIQRPVAYQARDLLIPLLGIVKIRFSTMKTNLKLFEKYVDTYEIQLIYLS